jgi:CRP-like cAMP-binding protein
MDYERGREKLDAFFAAGKEHTYTKRGVIIGYGDTEDRAYWIVDGRVTVISCSKDGNERIQHIYRSRELFPVKQIFDNEQYDIAFIAFNDVVVRSRPIADLLAYIQHEPDVLLAIIRQQTAVFDGLINLNYETAEQRIAFRLISLGKRFYNRKNGYALVSCPVTIQELASTVRVSSSTTGKILNKFEERGAVALRRNNILFDPRKLQMILAEG